ncbi:hypothetical protein IPJ63_01400 [Candidatus Nomurabacteria bacterium]|nr:MAG: hypothetical protein IPJ63_01400 [Candidatus Nomurabacteria bacterium]
MPKKTDKSTRSKLILLDTHAIVHRAYHALPDFASSKGEPTGAIYGLLTMLFKIITDLKPDYIVACYDLPQKTFRHEAYDNYKAGRAKTDDALVAQLKSSRKIFEALSIPMYDAPGFEADDMLGTITETLKKEKKIDIVIASGDMDTLQLVDDKRVQVFTLKKGINDTILYDEEKVFERFGFRPEFLPDYKGLRGDPSDNIIGIKGIGEKTAEILIQKFGTLEKMYKDLKKDSDVLKNAGLSDRISNLIKEGEEEAIFSKTLATIRRDAPIKFELPEKKFIESIDVDLVENTLREFEFKSLTTRARSVLGYADSATFKNEPLFSEDIPANEEVNLRIAYWLLNSEIADAPKEDILSFGGAKNLQEAKKNILDRIEKEGLSYVYENIELPIVPIIKEMEDTGVMVNTLYLKDLSDKYHTELKKHEKKIWEYAGREFNINSPKQLGEILFDEMKLIPETGRMKKTAGGARSTRESELEKLRGVSPIIDEIFFYRELQKLLSTYIDTIPSLVSEDGRLHAKFKQAGTTTGRFSSQDPNLQNIPTKTELGKNIRNAFVAKDGYELVSFDYSQIELRLAALMSGDEYLRNVFVENRDVHSAVAMRVFGVQESEVTSEMRRRAKVINFGILYGMGVLALKENLGTDRAEAQKFYDNYFAEFPSIQGYLDSVILEAKQKGYTETLFGRRRYFPGLKSKIPFIRAMAERMAINAPIQGTAADIIKIAIKNSHDALEKNGLINEARLILQVHDELMYEVKKEKIEEVKKIVIEAMKNVIPDEFLKDKKSVPLDVHISVGKNWGEMK